MVFCSNCGKENPNEAKFCSNCGIRLTQTNEIRNINRSTNDNLNENINYRYTEKPSKWNNLVSMVDTSTIIKGLIISIIIGIIFISYAGIFLGSMIAGYYTLNGSMELLMDGL